mgnify:CR=1 FL=1
MSDSDQFATLAQAEAAFGGPLVEIYGCTEAGQVAVVEALRLPVRHLRAVHHGKPVLRHPDVDVGLIGIQMPQWDKILDIAEDGRMPLVLFAEGGGGGEHSGIMLQHRGGGCFLITAEGAVECVMDGDTLKPFILKQGPHTSGFEQFQSLLQAAAR